MSEVGKLIILAKITDLKNLAHQMAGALKTCTSTPDGMSYDEELVESALNEFTRVSKNF